MVSHGDASVLRQPPTRLGPVTRALIARSLALYSVAIGLGSLPILLGWSAPWQAAGLGLWFPGAGFLAAGPVWSLLVPVGLAVFALAVFFWFGAGMVVAPVGVWLILAGLAALATGEQIWAPAPVLAGLAVAGFLGWSYQRHRARFKAGPAAFRRMADALPSELAAARARAVAAPPPPERELDREQLAAMRYALDRGLQDPAEWGGFDLVDEFQPAARRYQINFLAYPLALAQHDYLPSFHGYLSAAQRGYIDRYLRPEVWRYWVLETAWGHLNFRDFDPMGKDNIMLTGFLGQQIGLYMSATGDMRYTRPGSLVFEGVGKLRYEHSALSLVQSLLDNFERSSFCLYPCEPNWLYSACNHFGLGSVAVFDRLLGTDHTARIFPRWLENLHTEMTDPAGEVIALRSTYTGFEFKFVGSSALYGYLALPFAPERAWEQWTQSRMMLKHAIVPGADGVPRLMFPGRGFDTGYYRPGHGASYAGVANFAREFGDEELAQAAFRALDLDCGRTEEGGVLSYRGMSNSANAQHLAARLRRCGSFHEAMTKGPPQSALTGPLLDEAEYPAVLVAHALSGGEDLRIVLYPGMADGPRPIGFARLRPGASYRLAGTGNPPVTLVAGADGTARAEVSLAGRTELHLVPLAG